MRKRVLAVILGVCLVFSFTACSSDSSDSSSADVSDESAEAEENSEDVTDETENNEDTDADTEEDSSSGQVVYEDDVLTATFVEVTDVSGYIGIIFTLENNGSEEITVYPTDTSVNDAMVTFTSGVPATIQSGKHMTQTWLVNPETVGVESASEVTTFELSFTYDNFASQTDSIKIDLE